MAKKKKAAKPKFIASSSGARFHSAGTDCGHLRRIPDDNRLEFKTFKAAIAADKKPCPSCVLPKKLKIECKKPKLEPGVDVVKGPATAKTHNASGAFAVGNPGGPGNPYFKELHQTRKALSTALRSFDPEHVFEVLKEMYFLAISGEKGCVAASRIFLEYTLGKPTVTLALKTEGGPMSQLLDYVNRDRSDKEVVKAVSAEVIESKKTK